MVLPLTVLVPVIFQMNRGRWSAQEDDLDAVPVSRPWASRLVVVVPSVLDLPVVLPCASRKVALSEFDREAVPVVLPWHL